MKNLKIFDECNNIPNYNKYKTLKLLESQD